MKLFEAMAMLEKTGVYRLGISDEPLKSVSGVYFANDSDYSDCKLYTRMDCPKKRAL